MNTGLQQKAWQQKTWSRGTQEARVEGFYSHGLERYGEFHDGYLNFGLWEPGIADYSAAAENLVRRMGTLLGLGPGSRLLDAACGMGTQDIYLFRQFGPLQIDGLDVTWQHVERARRRAAASGHQSEVRFHHGSAVDLPFADRTFTHVMSIEGAEHFRTREKFLQEAQRVLRPGGVIALADYTLKRPPRSAWERFLVSSARRLWHIPQENVETRESYHATLARSGFTGISLEEVGALTYPGYYREQRRCLRQLTRIRGVVGGLLGHAVDIAAFQAYSAGLAEYVLVRAEKSAV